MAVRLVKIVNANGQVGRVPETHPALVRGDLRLAPSERPEVPVNLQPQNDSPAEEQSEAWEFGPSGDEATDNTSGESVADDNEE